MISYCFDGRAETRRRNDSVIYDQNETTFSERVRKNTKINNTKSRNNNNNNEILTYKKLLSDFSGCINSRE